MLTMWLNHDCPRAIQDLNVFLCVPMDSDGKLNAMHALHMEKEP